MVKPSNLAKLQKLQNIGVKASQMVEHEKNACIVDPTKVSIVLTSGNVKESTPDTVTSYPEGTMNLFIKIANDYDGDNTVSAVIPTKYLKTFVDNITGDFIKLSIRQDAPLVLFSTIEDLEVSMMIAPRIEAKDDD